MENLREERKKDLPLPFGVITCTRSSTVTLFLPFFFINDLPSSRKHGWKDAQKPTLIKTDKHIVHCMKTLISTYKKLTRLDQIIEKKKVKDLDQQTMWNSWCQILYITYWKDSIVQDMHNGWQISYQNSAWLKSYPGPQFLSKFKL